MIQGTPLFKHPGNYFRSHLSTDRRFAKTYTMTTFSFKTIATVYHGDGSKRIICGTLHVENVVATVVFKQDDIIIDDNIFIRMPFQFQRTFFARYMRYKDQIDGHTYSFHVDHVGYCYRFLSAVRKLQRAYRRRRSQKCRFLLVFQSKKAPVDPRSFLSIVW